MILAVNHIEKSYGIDTILENITFHIEEREKTAIVGVNGAGKTTLFRILTGEISSDGGDVFLKKETTMGYMAQNQQIESSRTIYEEMLSVFEKILTADLPIIGLSPVMVYHLISLIAIYVKYSSRQEDHVAVRLLLSCSWFLIGYLWLMH